VVTDPFMAGASWRNPSIRGTTNNPTSYPTTCVDEIGSVIFNKDIHRMGASKRKQKTLLHRERKRIPSTHAG
jgi:hypothetical protein